MTIVLNKVTSAASLPYLGEDYAPYVWLTLIMMCLDYYGSCIALLGLTLNLAYGYVLISKGNSIIRRIGELHIFDSLIGFLMYITAVLILVNEGKLISMLLSALGIKVAYITRHVTITQCPPARYWGPCVNSQLTITSEVNDPGSAAVVYGGLADSLVKSMTQLYTAEVILSTLPFVSPIGYYLNDVSRYFTWQAEWALMNAYLLYYLSVISKYASSLSALGASLIPIRQVRWIGGILFSLGVVTPIYVVTLANWLADLRLSTLINPSLLNDVKGILTLGTNLFSLGSSLEGFNVIVDISMALYSSILYGLSRVIGDVGLVINT